MRHSFHDGLQRVFARQNQLVGFLSRGESVRGRDHLDGKVARLRQVGAPIGNGGGGRDFLRGEGRGGETDGRSREKTAARHLFTDHDLHSLEELANSTRDIRPGAMVQCRSFSGPPG